MIILQNIFFIILLKNKKCIWVLSQSKIFHNNTCFCIINNPHSRIFSFIKHCAKFLPSFSNFYLCWKIKYFESLIFLCNSCIKTLFFPQLCHQDVSHLKKETLVSCCTKLVRESLCFTTSLSSYTLAISSLWSLGSSVEELFFSCHFVMEHSCMDSSGFCFSE